MSEWAARNSLKPGDHVTWVHHDHRHRPHDTHHAVICDDVSDRGFTSYLALKPDVKRSFGWSEWGDESPRYIAGRFGVVAGWIELEKQ